jgi:hypothetical protein
MGLPEYEDEHTRIAWDRIVDTHDRDATIAAVLVERRDTGWRLDVQGVAGILFDDAVLHPMTPPAQWAPGTTVHVKVLRYDRWTEDLLVWMPGSGDGASS